MQRARAGEPIIMGILNTTPDSFSDGGEFFSPSKAIQHAEQMLEDGADIIDIGAESTRPGSKRISAANQIERLCQVLPNLVKLGAPVSIDTTLSPVAKFAIDSGAQMLNDISAGEEDSSIFELAAKFDLPICLMHKKGIPETMQANPQYDNVVAEVAKYLNQRVSLAVSAGIKRENCIVDPGIGFGKTLAHNLALLKNSDQFCNIAGAVLVGTSRKRFIDNIADAPSPQSRLGGTIASCVMTFCKGASIFRVHDVAQTKQALLVAKEILSASKS